MAFKIKSRAEIAAEKATISALPQNGEEIKDGRLQPVQQDVFSGVPKVDAALDLANLPYDMRAVAYAAAKQTGVKILNQHLLDEKPVRKEPPANAMSLDFTDDTAKEAGSDSEIFRVSKRRDLDVFFEGLPVGPQFQDEIVKSIKEKAEKAGQDTRLLHFVVYCYLALAIPNDREAEDAARWATGPVSPKDFQRCVPKMVRDHFKIETWYRRSGSRCDAVWYKVMPVSNSKEALEAPLRAAELGKMAGAACEMILDVPKDSGYAKNILQAYKVD